MIWRPIAMGILAWVGVALPVTAQGRGRPCVVDLDHAELMQSYPQGGGKVTRYLSGDVRFRCAGQNVRLRSDSLISYDDYDTFTLIGNVHYVDDEYAITADTLRRYRVGERLELRGRAVIRRLRDSSLVEAPWIDYYRAVPGVNPVARLLTDGGSRATMYPTPAPGAPTAAPYLLTANRLQTVGEHLIEARGEAVLTRDSLRTTGDSIFYQGDTVGVAQVWGRPARAEDRTQDSVRLDGRHLWVAFDSTDQVREVRAMQDAHLARTGGTITGDTLVALLEGRRLSRVITWARGTTPAHLARDGYDATADSLVVTLLDERLETLHLFRRGRLEQPIDTLLLGEPGDTVAPPLRDWLTGDEVQVHFADVDSAGTAITVIRQLLAVKNSCSLASRREAAQTPGERTPLRSLNYTCADTIVIQMMPGLQREVETVHFRGNVTGAIMQPDRGTAAPERSNAPAAVRRPLDREEHL